jgi:hypothetical protein
MKKILLSLFLLIVSSYAMAQAYIYDDGCGSCVTPSITRTLVCNDSINGSDPNLSCVSALFRQDLAESTHVLRCQNAGLGSVCDLDGDIEWNRIPIGPFEFGVGPNGGYLATRQPYRSWNTIGSNTGATLDGPPQSVTCSYPDNGTPIWMTNGGG